jgi:HlyD family secretion protein
MNSRLLFIISGAGLATGLLAAYLSGLNKPLPPPVFPPASNAYAQGIFANGIIESYQANGENTNIYPEVAGTISNILVAEGDTVHQGQALLTLNDSVQKATTEQLKAQAEAAKALWEELQHQPRKEVLAVAEAQMQAAQAAAHSARAQMEKQQKSYAINAQSVSKDALDNAINTAKVAEANFRTAQTQYQLTKAGAWVYDIQNQEKQYRALYNSYLSANALLAKYTISAPSDGVVLAIKGAPGSLVSTQGVYDSYTQGDGPVLVMSGPQAQLQVRCYVDEILVPRLPTAPSIQATMFIRGSQTSIPLQFVRTQPYISPKIQLSDQRTERVDVRVLPVIFRFDKTAAPNVYPGQLVDVYIGAP